MKKITVAFLIALLVVFFTSCSLITFQTKDGKMAYLPNLTGTKVGSFEITITDVHLIGYLVHMNAPGPELDKIFKEQIAKYKGDAVANVSIEYHLTVIDFLLTYITGSIYNPSSVTITGDVIKL